MLKPDLSQWIGKTRTQTGRIGEELAHMLHATLSPEDAATPEMGDALPSLWHWTAFNPKAPMARLAEDGHPERGDFLPPVNLPRRMWAGGSVAFHRPIRMGAPLTQTSTITAVEEKSEAMTFVTLDHEVREDGALAVAETQNIVYLQIPERFSPPNPRPTPDAPAFDVAAPVSEALLFRYSAVTFNAHRIHYDLTYAQEVEKYPGLVVHGPLQATLLLAAAKAYAGREPARFDYRGVHPMFHDDDLHLYGFDETDTGMSLCTGAPGRHQGMSAAVTWRTSE